MGAAAAIMFAERGGSVAIHGRRQEKLDEVAARIEAVSGKKVSINERLSDWDETDSITTKLPS